MKFCCQLFIYITFYFFSLHNVGALPNTNKIFSIYPELTTNTHITINTNFRPTYNLISSPNLTLVFSHAKLASSLQKNYDVGVLKTIHFIQNNDNSNIEFITTVPSLANNFKILELAKNLYQISFDIEPKDKKANYYKNISEGEFFQQIIANNKKPHKFTIVLDPGHGGIDSGAVAYDGTLEKNITLKFAKILKQKLAQNPKIQVYLTREDDSYLYLDERIAKARKFGVDLFISIHADSISSPKIRGATIYTLSKKSSDLMAKSLEYSQNKVDELKAPNDLIRSPVENILIGMASAETKKYRSIIVQQLVDNIKRQKIFMIHNPTRSANFKVLKALDFPSVLIELGYLSSKSDKTTICSPRWQERMAQAIASAIENFRAIRSAR